MIKTYSLNYETNEIEQLEVDTPKINNIEVIPTPTLEERIQALETMELERILGGL